MQEREPLPADDIGNSPYYIQFTYRDLEGMVHDCVTQALSRETAELMLDEIPGARIMTEQPDIEN